MLVQSCQSIYIPKQTPFKNIDFKALTPIFEYEKSRKLMDEPLPSPGRFSFDDNNKSEIEWITNIYFSFIISLEFAEFNIFIIGQNKNRSI